MNSLIALLHNWDVLSGIKQDSGSNALLRNRIMPDRCFDMDPSHGDIADEMDILPVYKQGWVHFPKYCEASGLVSSCWEEKSGAPGCKGAWDPEKYAECSPARQ